jgi:hypothetical protein
MSSIVIKIYPKARFTAQGLEKMRDKAMSVLSEMYGPELFSITGEYDEGKTATEYFYAYQKDLAEFKAKYPEFFLEKKGEKR